MFTKLTLAFENERLIILANNIIITKNIIINRINQKSTRKNIHIDEISKRMIIFTQYLRTVFNYNHIYTKH